MESIKGTRDFFPEEMRFRRWLEGCWRKVAERYGYEEVDGPVLEYLELYTRKSGEEIVRQLYRFVDQGGRDIALRPEMTPSLARMLQGRGASLSKPIRWYSIPRLFRSEKPQRGRLREFFQLNLDLFGIPDESADAEIICACADILREVGLDDSDFRIFVNDRRLVQAILADEQVGPALFDTALSAIDKLDRAKRVEAEEQLLRVGLERGKVERVLGIFSSDPREVMDRYSGPAASLNRLRDFLEAGGAQEVVQPNLRIVRGLAYYTGIVFEIYAANLGLRAICGGGRYDSLVSEDGSAPLPAVGFGMGDAVLEELLIELKKVPALEPYLDLYVVPVRQTDVLEAIALARACRGSGLQVRVGQGGQAVKKELGRAVAAGARFALFVGESERASGRFGVRDLRQRVDLPPLSKEELPAVLRRRALASPAEY